jgi:hypothetical protein
MVPTQQPAQRMPWKATHLPKAQTAPTTPANAVSVVHVTVTAVTAANATAKRVQTMAQRMANKAAKPMPLR